MRTKIAAISMGLVALSATVAAQENTQTPTSSQSPSRSDAMSDEDLARLAKATANPLSQIWMLWNQTDTTHFKPKGETDSKEINVYKFQPVIAAPFNVGDDQWNLVVRPVLQYVDAPFNKNKGQLIGKSASQIAADPALLRIANESDYSGRTRGQGDTVLLTLAGPNREDGTIWGFGLTQIFPTADEKVLGQGKYQAGPALMLGHIAPKVGGMNYGVLAQYWQSYGGDADREDTKHMDLQYFLQYRLSPTEMVGMSPNIKYDWKAETDKRWTVPVGIGYTRMVRFGMLPVQLGVELQKYVVRPDTLGEDWNLRFTVVPIIPNPFAR